MSKTITKVPETKLLEVLRMAAHETVDAVQMQYGDRAECGDRDQALDVGLATIAARSTESIWQILPNQSHEWLVSAACAAQEIVEWASQQASLSMAGDDHCRGPITWWPQGVAGIGISDIELATLQRAALLQAELAHLQLESEGASPADLAA